MKKAWLYAVVIALLALAQSASAEEEVCDLECLLCPGLSDPKNYAEGVMKSLDSLAPGKDKWLFRSAVDLANDFGMPPVMRPEFTRLMATFAAKNIQVAIAVQPTRGLMHRDKIRPDHAHGFDYAVARHNLAAYIEQLRQGGALVPDIMPLVENPPREEYFFRRDHHWTPAGARATARIVADAILGHPVHAQLSTKRFRTEAGVIIPKDGTMNRGLKRICGNNYGFQYVRGLRTIPEEADASALFDEAATEVVLVGTSNSASRDDEAKNYNFEGFLKEYLSVDILNYALPGADQDGSLIQYLHSSDYDPKAPPKLIVWELPANFSLEAPLTYRQLIPAINGGCAHSPEVLASASRDLPELKTAQRIELLSNTGRQRQDLQDLNRAFLEIKISDSKVKDFYIITYYDNGSRDKVWYRREGVVDGGLYYLELSQAPEHRGANLMSVFMEPVKALETPTTVEVQLCR